MPFAQLMAVLPLRDVACSLRVNDSVGVFLVQRIAALSVKHNMSSVSVLGGW